MCVCVCVGLVIKQTGRRGNALIDSCHGNRVGRNDEKQTCEKQARGDSTNLGGFPPSRPAVFPPCPRDHQTKDIRRDGQMMRR